MYGYSICMDIVYGFILTVGAQHNEDSNPESFDLGPSALAIPLNTAGAVCQ